MPRARACVVTSMLMTRPRVTHVAIITPLDGSGSLGGLITRYLQPQASGCPDSQWTSNVSHSDTFLDRTSYLKAIFFISVQVKVFQCCVKITVFISGALVT